MTTPGKSEAPFAHAQMGAPPTKLDLYWVNPQYVPATRELTAT